MNQQMPYPAQALAGQAIRAVLDGPVLSYSENEFLKQLGDRLRSMRLGCHLTRRELSRRSRISERYIARIESGKGNVSIVLLLRIAHALRGEEAGEANSVATTGGQFWENWF